MRLRSGERALACPLEDQQAHPPSPPRGGGPGIDEAYGVGQLLTGVDPDRPRPHIVRPSCRRSNPEQVGWSTDSQQNSNVGGTLRAVYTEVGEDCHTLPPHTEVAHSLTFVVCVNAATG